MESSVSALDIAFLLVPETKGKTLEQIEAHCGPESVRGIMKSKIP